MKDYFPLKSGMRLEYSYSSTEFDSIARVSIVLLGVRRNARETVAHARMIVTLKGCESATEYEIKKTAKGVITGDGIIIGGRKEFPLPAKEGLKWEEYPETSEIVSLTDKFKLGAQVYSNCLKVLTHLSGGEGGMAVRYYAPGVGYIHEEYNAEDLQASVSLIGVSTASGKEMKLSRKKLRK